MLKLRCKSRSIPADIKKEMWFKFFRVLIVFFLNSLTLSAQDIQRADSLFNSRKYTEANEIFESIYADQKASPSMLMKMAFIQEGLGNYAEALFFLNQYYELTANKKVLEKMREIAEENELTGYEYSDIEFFGNLVQKYKHGILGVLFALSILLLAMTYRYKKQKNPNYTPVVMQVLVCVLLLAITNDFFSKPKAIVNRDQTLLMTGPSAGAEPIELIKKGHKVSILETTDAWVKIGWGDREGYIRRNRIKPI